MKKIILYLSLLLLLIIVAGSIYLSNINNFKRDGSFQISKNEKPIQINRDEYGIAYVFAESKADVIRGQGFVTGQDRVFQIEFYRALIKGELASFIGESMLQSDIKMRVLNLPQMGVNGFQYLNQETKDFLQWYCEGYNEYLKVGKDELPVELSLLNIETSPIRPEELVAVVHFIGLTHGRNLEDEVLSLNLASRTQFANELLPLNDNPDRSQPLNFQPDTMLIGFSESTFFELPDAITPLLPLPKLGSNNWAISKGKSKSGQVIVCNDPHLDARLLPGIFHPVGLFCPEFKGIGVAIPGIPGLMVGRSEYVSFGVTNGYGDSQDLIIEKVEGDQYYFEGDKRSFEKRKEVIEVKDGKSVEIEVRSTVHGPIISDFEIFGIMTKDVVSLRWSQKASQSPSLGVEQFLEAQNVYEFRKALAGIDNMFFNFVIGDVEGNIAHQSTGLVPKRLNHQGTLPLVYDNSDNWNGFIPKDELPHMINPQRAWVGTANHDTRPDNYPHYYSAHFSPNYRYARMKEVLEGRKQFDADELWQLILDTKNKQAEKLSPIFENALMKNEETIELGKILKDWNHNDQVDEVGATVYNVLYDVLANLVLDDELPDDQKDQFWANGYYWNQRFDEMVLSNHEFIDNTETAEKESLEALIIEAGLATKVFLTKQIGPNSKNWTWGKIHTVKFASPIRQTGFGSSILGAEVMPKNGSNNTINRGGYTKTDTANYETGWFSTFRMLADLSDNEKIRGVLSGGSAARLMHPYYKAQLEVWDKEEWIPYWFSKKKIVEHSAHELILE